MNAQTTTIKRNLFLGFVRMRGDWQALAKVWTFLILGGIFTAVFWTAYALISPDLPPPFSPASAETGDFIEVDYVGWFPDAPGRPARVFDTSVESVARDNATYPKAASFTYRSGVGASYAPLQFTMGCESGAGCPLPAFQAAILRMRIGDTKIVTLTPDQAYGHTNPALVEVRPLLEEVAITETMNAAEFQNRFAASPMDGSIVTDLEWGWNVTVRVSGDLITTRQSPILGQTASVAGRWQAKVVGIDDGANAGQGVVTVRHLLTASDVSAFQAQDDRGTFIVVALDPVAGTYTVDYNTEVVGKALVFELTLKGLRKGRR